MSFNFKLGDYTMYYSNGRGDSYVFRNRANQNIRVKFIIDGVEYIRRTIKILQWGYDAIPVVSLNGKQTKITGEYEFLKND